MAKLAVGWHFQPDGTQQLWDGAAFTDFRPPPPRGDRAASRGWYPEYADVYRWWSGQHWVEARSTTSGRFSVAEFVGQTVITMNPLGVPEVLAVKELLAYLRPYPPTRIIDLTVKTPVVAAGTIVVAVVEWEPVVFHPAAPAVSGESQ